MKNSFHKKWWIFIACIILVQLAGVLGSIFSVDSIESWYSGLEKPSFNPPNWIFGPVWTALYFMIGISLFLFIIKKGSRKEKRAGYWIFGVQLFLNAIWSIVFFGMHQIFLALIVIILLWISIFLNIPAFFRISKISAYLLVPYWLWVSFASVLNWAIWILNK